MFGITHDCPPLGPFPSRQKKALTVLFDLIDMAIILYVTTVSSNAEIKKHQQKITMLLQSKKIPYTTIDISANEADRQKMRDGGAGPHALPPQLYNGDVYLGDYAQFEQAVEDEALEAFLKL